MFLFSGASFFYRPLGKYFTKLSAQKPLPLPDRMPTFVTAVPRLYSHHAWVSLPMADARHAHYVSYSGHDVRQARAARRKGSSDGIRRRVPTLHGFYRRFYAAYDDQLSRTRG